ncbi:ammonium transporter [Olsenella sp. YH-ols2217]|uniref:Ammonium transporter n=1 Tax=Kribbibacterium absianum TaxID=3044210 RepID=A0ABT6ZHS8_9ACTN|nr:MULTISPECIES: ammonium transporter [unclassified Olsenella]MDJ1121123.1 ammonium transporter [Olsenella sp. YH-ols2216]MDJ1128614.1 ammonium transporter [Olsenella sp. YH-ols2217]
MFDTGDTAFILICAFLVFIMTLGISFFYGGMVRRKNVGDTMLLCTSVAGLISVLWIVVGYSLVFGSGFSVDGVANAVLGGLDKCFLTGVTIDTAWGTIPEFVWALYQGMFALITVAIISGAIVERMRFSSFLVFIGAWMLIVYCPLAHMVWGGGWIDSVLGAHDFAGGDVVHISSGVSALVLAMILGPRFGNGRLNYQPHNVPFVLLGTLFLWLGWFGFNAGSAGAANGQAGLAFATTNTAAAAAMLAWMACEKLATGKVTLFGACSGAVAGLVAVTPSAGYVDVWASLVIGALVAVVCYFAVSKLKPRMGYDDALDAFGVHGVGGMVGTVLTGVFANPVLGGFAGLLYGDPMQVVRQLGSVLFVVVWAGGLTFVIAKAVERVGHGLRVSHDQEEVGLDMATHGEPSYPAYQGMDLH